MRYASPQFILVSGSELSQLGLKYATAGYSLLIVLKFFIKLTK
jgi:hypothetical protein